MKEKLFLILILTIIILVGACQPEEQQPLYENKNTYIDNEVYLGLEREETIEVIITLKEGVNLEQFISDLALPIRDFEVIHKSSSGRAFDARITKKGLEDLESNDNVLSIFVQVPIEIQNE